MKTGVSTGKTMDLHNNPFCYTRDKHIKQIAPLNKMLISKTKDNYRVPSFQHRRGLVISDLRLTGSNADKCIPSLPSPINMRQQHGLESMLNYKSAQPAITFISSLSFGPSHYPITGSKLKFTLVELRSGVLHSCQSNRAQKVQKTIYRGIQK
jgi:hypothetical protein